MDTRTYADRREYMLEYQRAYRKENRARINELVQAGRQKRYDRNPEKILARNAVYAAVKRGTLVRPEGCSSCGIACKPEASHNDYKDRFDVEWLCRTCHLRKDGNPYV